MKKELAQAETYRRKAKEIRHKLESVKDLDMRRVMRQIATDYESMANTLVALSRSETTLKRLSDDGSN